MKKSILLLLFIILLIGCDSDPKARRYSGIPIYGFNGNYKLIKVPIPDGGIHFPIGYDDGDTAFISNAFYIGETQVTMSMYFTVAKWAQENRGYKNLIIPPKDFAINYPFNIGWYASYATDNSGSSSVICCCSGYIKDDYPIIGIPYTGAIIWCNAYTEWHNYKYNTNYTPVYVDNNGEPIRNAILPFQTQYSEIDIPSFPSLTYRFWHAYNLFHDYLIEQDGIEKYFYNFPTTGNGFRLPTADEWELAARWSNDLDYVVWQTINGINFNNQKQKFRFGDSVSGCPGPTYTIYGSINNLVFDYAVFSYNSAGILSVPRTKKPNALGIYDMSGNLRELVYDIIYLDITALDSFSRPMGIMVPWPFAMSRGGSYIDSNPIILTVGYPIYVDAATSNYYYGFRVARDF